MLRYFSMILLAVLPQAQVVSAEAITYRFLNLNSHVIIVEFGVPVTIPSTFRVADLEPTIQSPQSEVSDEAAAWAGAVSSASASPRPHVSLPVAEPATLALLGIGFLLLSAFGRRRR